MEIRMEHTEGFSRSAEVWIGEQLLTVCDGLSTPDAPCPPGPVEDVSFGYVTVDGMTWRQASRDNPSRRQVLEHVRGWSYVGYGQVKTIMPVVIDFGLLQMEDANWTNDENLIGQYVAIPIDRLEIAPPRQEDWPEGLR